MFRFLRRLDWAAFLIFALLIVVALGSFFPQHVFEEHGPRYEQWERAVRARYGRLTEVLMTVGAFHLGRAPLFLLLMGLMALSTLVCTLKRGRVLWTQARRPFQMPGRALCTARLTVADSRLALDKARDWLEHRSFKARVETTRGARTTLYGARHRLTPLATLVTHTALLLMLVGAGLSWAYGWREIVTVAAEETFLIEHGLDVTLKNIGLTMTHYLDGSAASYTARVQTGTKGKPPSTHMIRLNEPLYVDGVAIHLHGYGGLETDPDLTLLLVHDPGVVIVICAGFLLLCGMTVTFNFPHAYIQGCFEPTGDVSLRGHVERQTYAFEQEFADLVTTLDDV